ncbi:MAG: chromosomal replication initiator protein DnaA [Bacilli bacterium]
MRETVSDRQVDDINKSFLDEIRNRIDEQLYDGMFSGGSFELKSLANGKASFVADSASNALMIKNLFTTEIKEALKEVTETDFEIYISDKATYSKKKAAIDTVDSHFFQNSHISFQFTFENFVTGPCNKTAYQASLFSVESPGTSNPIFIYSDSGMGKTHLLQAIGNAYLTKHPDSNVLYITTDDFVTEFVKFIKGNKNSESLKDFFSTVDLLLVDDIQFLGGKEDTQVMFFNVFNLMVSHKKQIVLTSDKAPSELKGLQDRLISRFSGGLSISINNPDKSTIMEILKLKIKTNNLDLDLFDIKVLEYLALNYSKNIRVLEGALTKLIFSLTVQKEVGKVTLAFAKSVFEDDEKRKSKMSKIDIDSIITAVSEYYSLTPSQLKSKVRTSQIALARQIAMYLSRSLLSLPYQEIGKQFGKDHTTVLANCQKIQQMAEKTPSVGKVIAELSNQIAGDKKKI